MKKLLAIAITVAIMISLTGCGKEEDHKSVPLSEIPLTTETIETREIENIEIETREIETREIGWGDNCTYWD